MATVEEIETLRRIVAEPSTANYTDLALSGYIEDAGSVDGAAAVIWQEKAAKASKLVNVSESGSSRSLQQIYSNALEMAKFYQGKVDNEVVDGGLKTTFPSERP